MVDEPEEDDDSKDDGPVEWVSYWKPNITINLVADFTQYVSWDSFNFWHIFLICSAFFVNIIYV